MTPLDAPEPGFRDMPLLDVPAPPASVRKAASRRLQARFLRAGCEAVDDRELLELLLSGRRPATDAAAIAASLLDIFGTAPRVLAARPDRLRTVPGLSEDAIAAIKTAEALGIRMARADVPDTVRPSFGNYSKVIEYCRTLAGHREVGRVGPKRLTDLTADRFLRPALRTGRAPFVMHPALQRLSRSQEPSSI